jgi:hypothetical protein
MDAFTESVEEKRGRMTKDEFRDYVDFLRSQDEISYDVYSGLIDGIDTLEQEPCEDCISRQAVLAIAGDSCLDLDSYEDTKDFCDEINELPPVTPQPKTGHWIEEFNDLEGEVRFTCSSCGKYQLFGTDYCYNCGTKMVESQESEEE